MELANGIVTYNRKFEGNRTKDITYEAWFIKPESDLQYMQEFNKVPFSKIHSAGIDKISLCLPLDYVNEGAVAKYSNGAFSTRRHGAYFHINIHGEYIDHSKNLLKQVEHIVLFLMKKGAFKVPIRKEVVRYEDFPKVGNHEEIYFERFVETADDFFRVILDNMTFTNIEFNFDYTTPIFPLLDSSDFHLVGGSTFYSKDYKVYSEASRKKSMVCIYDKTKQMKDVKKVELEEQITRFEIKIYSQQLKYLGGMKLLDITYEKLFSKLKPCMVKKLRKLKIDFLALSEGLPLHDRLKSLLEAVMHGLKVVIHEVKKVCKKIVKFFKGFKCNNAVGSKKFFYLIKTTAESPYSSICWHGS